MAVAAKICGLSTEEPVEAAVAGGAAFVGFVFHPRSPRFVSTDRAASLIHVVARPAVSVGLFVDAEIETILRVLDRVELGAIQLHGRESPAFASGLARRAGRPVWKALPIAGPADLDGLDRWVGAVDRLLFDANPPAGDDALTGGNGASFNWDLLTGRRIPIPWLLAGGLNTGNVRLAVRRSGADHVDVSSGVEISPGIKDAMRIREFLAVTNSL